MSIPSGLRYQEEILTPEQEQTIVSWLDQQPWSTALKRRTQQYGYIYDYTSKSISPTPTTPISGPLQTISDWLASSRMLRPTQCIVNEYTKNQGIAAHTDSPQFGPTIVSISLLAPTNMDFTRGQEKFSLTLAPRSIVVLTGEARSQWKHQIPVRQTVTMPDGSNYHKSDDYRRISLTYRTLSQ